MLPSTKIKILRVFINNPLTYKPILSNMIYNKGYIYKTLNQFIPTDTGIEFEIGEKAISELRSKNYKLYCAFKRDSNFELTKRFKTLNDYKVLYDLIEFLTTETAFPIKGGIHIHTNVFSTELSVNTKRKLINRINDSKILYLLKDIFKYEGTFNQIKAASCKGNFLTIRSDFNTLEYRGIPMQSSYSELMKIIFICHYVTRLFMNENFIIENALNEIRSISKL